MRFVHVILPCLLFATGCNKPTEGMVLGRAPDGKPTSILSVRAGTTPPQVTLRGVMVEKCPAAGCWFRLKDGLGIIKVDTKSAGFVVVNIPLEARLTVSGKVVPDGNDVEIEATGIRYQ